MVGGTSALHAQSYFTSGCPGDRIANLCSFAVMRVRSASVLAADRRFRSCTIFSFRVRRRRISGRRLGADMSDSSFLENMSGEYSALKGGTPIQADAAVVVNVPARRR